MPNKHYHRMYWACPFYKTDTKEQLRCEAGRFEMDACGVQYCAEYCADHLGWRRCTMARAVLRRYEAEDEAEGYGPALRPKLA